MQNKKEQRARMLDMINQWEQSGLSQKAFCISHSIPYHVFYYWFRVSKSEQKSSGTFLPLNIIPAQSPEQITITGMTGIRVQIPFTNHAAGFIKQLLLS